MLGGKGLCLGIEPETGQPQSQALSTLQEVLSWKPTKEQLFYSQYSVTKGFVRPTEPRTRPYTLVCHDFKGGYLEDRYLQGGKKKDAYYFCRWECIDIFVYFSHHFVTVPPRGWVQAAHKHGTMILGTVITEWDDGAAIWSSVLSSKDTLRQLVSNLVSICQLHGFDGWLVNVENKVEESQVDALREFVQLLTEQSHQQLPGSKIVWYDSVTQAGELKWQDELNEQNSLFFDACDGIFLNYCWTPEKLAASKDVAEQKDRPFDVFVGIDVFGRGCPGGGGFNTREALQHARKHDLSAAIFAPGWVLETLGVTDFDENDCRFWAKLHDLCPLSDGGGLPVSSAFCQGHGDDFFCMGQEMTGRRWFNMSLQQRQPERTLVYGFQDPSKMSCQPSLNTCLSSAYLGGCSIELSAHLTRPLQTVSFRVFSVRAKLDETLYCSYTYKENSDVPCDVYLVLTFGSGLLTHRAVMGSADKPTKELEKGMFSEGAETEDGEPVSKRARTDTEMLYVMPMTEAELEPLQSSVWFHNLQEEKEGRDQLSWKTRHFKVDTRRLMPDCKRTDEQSLSITISLSRPTTSPSLEQSEGNGNNTLHEDIQRTSVLMGHVQVFREQDLKLQAPRVTHITLEKLEPLNIGFTGETDSSNSSAGKAASSAIDEFLSEPSYVVRWDVEGDAVVDYFNVYLSASGSPKLIGHTPTTTFVTAIAAKFVCSDRVTVTVQPVLSATGLPQALSKCASESVALSVV